MLRYTQHLTCKTEEAPFVSTHTPSAERCGHEECDMEPCLYADQSEAQRLLDAATPLPWRDNDGIVRMHGDRVPFRTPADAALTVYAVNRLPDSEAAVEAWGSLLDMLDNQPEAVRTAEYIDRWKAARAALARLRGGEAA
jgi:hypothetical protein